MSNPVVHFGTGLSGGIPTMPGAAAAASDALASALSNAKSATEAANLDGAIADLQVCC